MAELIIALDTSDKFQALRWAKSLKGISPWVKVGLELLTRSGPSVVQALKNDGFRVFVDMKLFDIPNTVARSVHAAAAHADMLTLHTLGGRRMLCAAVKAANEAATQQKSRSLLLGVTVLTSMQNGELPGCDTPFDILIPRLALTAKESGLDGVVCSAHEVPAIKELCGTNFLCVTPGIRPVDTDTCDQVRIMTPAAAVAAGSDYLVVGRPVTQSANPAFAARTILNTMQRRQP